MPAGTGIAASEEAKGGGMATDPLETAWKLQAGLTDSTGKADAKASFALAIQSTVLALLGILTSAGKSPGNPEHGVSLILLWVGAALLACGACCAAAAVSPNLRKERRGPQPDDDFLFFGHLRHWDPTDLETALKDKDLLPNLSRQIVVMSEIAWTKHRRVQWSFALAAIGSAALGLASIVK
ncbi:Pycsar system effector family protein [Streptomyces mutabilis]|uniref:Pycsar system effector family protein n=1 Tax=Streptomyces mutabilis TaxID=67332 RepID=UPI00177DE2C7|nr:Pycsar system effector family protein [Streptomyces mutabilis]